jgi:cytoskeletal protein CcmA (bactofilin family)
MRERWRRRRGASPLPPLSKPVPVRTPEPGLIGWREIRTFLDPGTEVTGKLNFTNPTRIGGRLRGEVRATDLLVVAPGGSVQGTIRASVLIVAGEVRGQILGAERVEVQAGGRVSGFIEARALVAAEGAVVEADCRLGGEAAPRVAEAPATA